MRRPIRLYELLVARVGPLRRAALVPSRADASAASHARSWMLAFAAAASATFVTAFTWMRLEPSPSAFFLAAILLVALYGGIEAGLVVTALCVPALVRFLRPPYAYPGSGIETTARIATFVAAERGDRRHRRGGQAGERRHQSNPAAAGEGTRASPPWT